jgi:hypothetical protein
MTLQPSVAEVDAYRAGLEAAARLCDAVASGRGPPSLWETPIEMDNGELLPVNADAVLDRLPDAIRALKLIEPELRGSE